MIHTNVEGHFGSTSLEEYLGSPNMMMPRLENMYRQNEATKLKTEISLLGRQLNDLETQISKQYKVGKNRLTSSQDELRTKTAVTVHSKKPTGK